MQHVCHDTNGDTEWFYDPSASNYVRYKKTGEVAGVIGGQYLPDPYQLWGKRCDVYGVKLGTTESNNVKPQPATFSLWEHWSRLCRIPQKENLTVQA